MAIRGTDFHNGRWGSVKKNTARILIAIMVERNPQQRSPLWRELIDEEDPSKLLNKIIERHNHYLFQIKPRSAWWEQVHEDLYNLSSQMYASYSKEFIKRLNKIQSKLRSSRKEHKKEVEAWRKRPLEDRIDNSSKKPKCFYETVRKICSKNFYSLLASARTKLDTENYNIYWDSDEKKMNPNYLLQLGIVDKAINETLQLAQTPSSERSAFLGLKNQQCSSSHLVDKLLNDLTFLQETVQTYTALAPGYLLGKDGKESNNHDDLFHPRKTKRERLNRMVELLFESNEMPSLSLETLNGWGSEEGTSDNGSTGKEYGYNAHEEDENNPLNRILHDHNQSESETQEDDVSYESNDLDIDIDYSDTIPEKSCVNSEDTLNSILGDVFSKSNQASEPKEKDENPQPEQISQFPSKPPSVSELEIELLSFFRDEVDDRVKVMALKEIFGDRDWGSLEELVNSARSQSQNKLSVASMEEAFGASNHLMSKLAESLTQLAENCRDISLSQAGPQETADRLQELKDQKVSFLKKQTSVFSKKQKAKTKKG